MAIPSPDHLLDQARALAANRNGATRQVDLRRAISSVYYAMFHEVLSSAARLIVSSSSRLFPLVYRSLDHRTVRSIAADLRKATVPSRYESYLPPGGFSDDIRDFAATIYDMQEKRHEADYDPSIRVEPSDVLIAISTARAALTKLRGADPGHRQAFLFLMLFKMRNV